MRLNLLSCIMNLLVQSIKIDNLVANISIGTPPQYVPVLLDFSSQSSWVANKSKEHPYGFNSTNSTTMKWTEENPKSITQEFTPYLQVEGPKFIDHVNITNAQDPKDLPREEFQLGNSITGELLENQAGSLGMSAIQPKDNFDKWILSNQTLSFEDFSTDQYRPFGRLQNPGSLGLSQNNEDERLWGTAIRGVGIGSKNLDFNSLGYTTGIVAKIDPSQKSAIRFSSALFKALQIDAQLIRSQEGRKCSFDDQLEMIVCSCESDDLSTFPTVKISMEPTTNVRYFGIDQGSEALFCIPPKDYITQRGQQCFIHLSSDPFDTFVLGRALANAKIGRKDDLLWISNDAGNPEIAGQDCETPLNKFYTGERISWYRIFAVLLFASITYGMVVKRSRPRPITRSGSQFENQQPLNPMGQNHRSMNEEEQPLTSNRPSDFTSDPI